MISNIIKLFKDSDSALWVENTDLKVAVTDKVKSLELKNLLIQNKNELLEFLELNKIYDKNTFFDRVIFRYNHNINYQLSFAQERLWFIQNYEACSNVYNIPFLSRLSGEVNFELLKQSLESVLARHEVLHSLVKTDIDGNCYQELIDLNETPFLIHHQLITRHGMADLVQTEFNHVFHLNSAYPLRATLIELQESGEKYLLIVIHHIVFDGWSMDILIRDLQRYYDYYLGLQSNDNNKTHVAKLDLPELTIQYRDFALWQRDYLSGERLEQQLWYWKNKLSGYENLSLPSDKPRPSLLTYVGEYIQFAITRESSDKLRSLAKQLGVSLYSVLLAGFNLLLHIYSNQDDIVIGTPISNRHHEQLEDLIGFFANTLVLRSQIKKSQVLAEYIQVTGLSVVEAQIYQDLPFEKLVQELNVSDDRSRHPIFQVMFGMQSFGNQASSQGNQLFKQEHIDGLEIYDQYKVAKFDLTLMLNDSQAVIEGSFNYATSLFRSETIKVYIETYQHILNKLTENPQQQMIADLSYLTPPRYKQMIHEWNQTNMDYPEDKTIHELFEEQVERTPNNIAVVYEDVRLTYKEINERSNRLAHYLKATYQITGDDLIALCLGRSEWMIIAILGVLKSGAGYVPLDPSYPDERISYVLSDIRAKAVLVDEGNLFKLKAIINDNQLLAVVERVNDDLFNNYSSFNLVHEISSHNLAYVIYTSGTTGKPKGVMIEHKGVVNLAIVQAMKFGLPIKLENAQLSKNCLCYANYVFDAHVSELVTAICNGHIAYVVKDSIRQNVELLANYISANKIYIATIPPVLLTIDTLLTVDTLVVAGDKTYIGIMEYYKKNNIQIINAYGPTESTVCAILNNYESGDLNTNIGKPIGNTRAYILDASLNPVPIGAIGELYIGGAGVARGYLNLPELTNERFITNPFQSEEEKTQGENSRLYKTGDLVRYLPDSNIEYIGRNDFQVKIRGFRIELGEIETKLSSYPGIKQAVVVTKSGYDSSGLALDDKYLVGYYVADEELDELLVVDYLRDQLPEYMVPNVLFWLDKLPLTINGKLDRKALPDPDLTNIDNYVAPRNELELQICEIYAQVLGLATEKVGTSTNFFKMGGNSILTIRLKAKLNQLNQFKDLSIADLFKYSSIQKLVEKVYDKDSADYKLQEYSPSTNHEIAIIGMSGAFSGVDSINELWRLITTQLEGIHQYTLEECKKRGVNEDLLQADNYIPVVGQVNNTKLFDPEFWEISVNEAKQTDPQIRKFIEHCYWVLEQSGYAKTGKKHHIGVFAGIGGSNYFYNNILNGEESDKINLWEASISNSKDALATKTAYFLGLTGPCISINTACSTGLVTVVEACQKLQLGVCDMALAGGVSLAMPDQIGYLYQDGMIMSEDGHCRPFDKDASGTVGGSGVGVVLLKRLDDAIRDNDNIIAVIKGYVTNNDGDRKTGYTAPSVVGQAECILNAQRMAGVKADEIDYIECHGTATALGDPIEIQALKEAFIANSNEELLVKNKCYLGAVKANIGHADSAAGIAGLIKTCLMLQNNIIPGQTNFKEANPELNLETTNFEIIIHNKDWKLKSTRKRVAGVSSFGVGGTNAHLIISDYIATDVTQEFGILQPEADLSTANNFIFPISAKSRKSLDLYRQKIIDYLSQEELTVNGLGNISYTLRARESFEYRYCITAATQQELLTKLQLNLSPVKSQHEGMLHRVFMFPGQGVQYPDMTIDLYKNEIIFRTYVNECVAIANNYLEANLMGVLYPGIYSGDQKQEDINQTKWTQISLFVVSYSLAKLLESMGIKPDTCIGHSIGEYVAATLCGVFKLEDAIRLIIIRGRLMQAMEPGSMLAIQGERNELEPIILRYDCELSLINSPQDVVASGTDDAIDKLKYHLDQKNINSVKLVTSHAYHSKMMDRAATEFEKELITIKLNMPTRKFISSRCLKTYYPAA